MTALVNRFGFGETLEHGQRVGAAYQNVGVVRRQRQRLVVA